MTSPDSSSPLPAAVPGGADHQTLKWAAALALLVLVAYWPTLNNGFIWDDDEYVQNNAQLRTTEGLYNIWFRFRSIPQYYPLVHTTFWAEYQVWGLNAVGYHAVNLALHALCAVLVWRLLLRLNVPGAWLAAAVFAVHPVEVETVAWISERKNLLSCALALGSILAYLRFAPGDAASAAPPAGRWRFYLLALLLYLGAMLSKTVVISTPAVLLVLRWWQRGRLGWREVAPLVPMLLVGLPLALVTVWLEREHVGAVGADWDLSWVDRFLVAGRSLWFYAAKLVWPGPLVFFYHRFEIDAGQWWQYLYPLTAVALPVGLWLARGRIGRGPLAAVLIFGGVLFPALGFFDVYPFRFSFVADHFQYHASIAMIALLVAAGTRAFERFTADDSTLRLLAGGGLLLALSLLTNQRVYAFRDLLALWQDTLAKNPQSWAARYNLGDALITAGRRDEGLAEIRATVEQHPDQVWVRAGLASLLSADGQYAEAEKLLHQVLADERYPRSHADAHLRLGNVLAAQQRLDEAQAEIRRALELEPENHRAWIELGLTLARQGHVPQAVEQVGRAVELNPYDPQAQHALGVLLFQQSKIPTAIEHLRTAVLFFPGNASFRVDLAAALLVAADVEGAELQLREAVRVDPRNAQAFNLLGKVLVKRRNLGAAIRAFEQALALDPNFQEAKANLQQARSAGAR